MKQVTLEALDRELAAAVTVMGHAISLWTGDLELAARFGGWDVDADWTPEAVDLDRFELVPRLRDAHRYAFHPTLDDMPDLTDLHELAEVLAGLPREDFKGEANGFPNNDSPSVIRDTVEAVWARAAIDGIDDHMTVELSVRQVALLAGMTEGAVRNAMVQKGDAKLTAIPGSKPVRIDVDEARRWLEGRRGYKPTPKGEADDPLMDARLRGFERMEQLTDFIARHARRRYGEVEGLTAAIGWENAALGPWLEGSFSFDATAVDALARALGADVATFAGKALELSMRRYAEQGDAR